MSVREQLATLGGAIADLTHSMNPKAPPGPLAAEGMTPDRHYRDLLRLNPGDNQGIRYPVLPVLLRAERFEEADGLMNRGEYEDEGSALFEYARALLAFRQHGDSAVAKTALADAIDANRPVPKYLMGRAALPVLSPPYITPGEDSEAAEAAEWLLDAWRSTPGATAWLAAQTPRSAGRRTGARKGKGQGKSGGGKRKRR